MRGSGTLISAMVRTVSARFAGGELIAPPVWHLLYAVLCFFALLEFQHVFTLFVDD